jgi:hypothetical protein
LSTDYLVIKKVSEESWMGKLIKPPTNMAGGFEGGGKQILINLA